MVLLQAHFPSSSTTNISITTRYCAHYRRPFDVSQHVPVIAFDLAIGHSISVAHREWTPSLSQDPTIVLGCHLDITSIASSPRESPYVRHKLEQAQKFRRGTCHLK